MRRLLGLLLCFGSVFLLPAQSLEERAQGMLDQGLAAFQGGELDRAWDIWEHALDTLEAQSAEDEYADLKATCLDLMGVVADASGDLVSAIEYMEEALEIRENMPEPDFSDIGYCNNNLGAAYFMLADWELALDHYQESQRNYFSSGDSLEAAWPMTNCGLAYLRSDDFGSALRAFAAAEPWVRRSKDVALRHNLFINWGLAEIQTGNWTQAQQHLLAVLGEVPAHSKAGRSAAANLGFGHLKAGQLTEALLWLEKALAEGDASLPDHHRAKVMLHMAQAKLLLNQPSPALDAANRGLSLLTDTLITDKAPLPATLTGNYDRRTMLQLVFERCKALADLGKWSLAMQDMASLLTVMDELRQQMQADESRLFFSGFAQPIHQFVLSAALQMRAQGQQPDMDLVFACFLRNKAMLLRENREKARKMQISDAPQGLRRMYLGAKRMLAYLDQQITTAKRKGSDDLEELEQQRFGLAKRLRRLEKELKAEVGELAQPEQPDFSTKSALAWMEGNKTPILAYFVGPEQVFGCYLGLDGQAKWDQLGYRAEVEQHVQRFLRACKDWNYIFTWPDSAALDIRLEGVWLFEHLVRPMLGQNLPNQLQIIPDGLLSLLPFEALLTQAPAPDQGLSQFPWFIRSTCLSYNVQSPELHEVRKPKNPVIKLPHFVLAMAPFDQDLGKDSLALPGAVKEVQSLSVKLRSHIMVGEDATWEHLLKYKVSNEYLHLALHGKDDLDSTGQGYLVFAGGEKVEAWRIASTDLNLDLVFLSACETGSGSLAKGEGVLSLSRSFLEAGARSVVMSLWRLEDAKSGRIVEDFYTHLAAGDDFQHALQNAKLGYLDQADDFSAMPAFWAPLVLNGEVGVQEEEPFDLRLLAILAILGLAVILIPVVVKQVRKFSH